MYCFKVHIVHHVTLKTRPSLFSFCSEGGVTGGNSFKDTHLRKYLPPVVSVRAGQSGQAMQDRKDVVKNVNWTIYGENLQSKMKFMSDHVRPSLFSFWSEVRVTGGNLPISPIIAPFRTYL